MRRSWYQVFAELTVKVQKLAQCLPCPDLSSSTLGTQGTVQLPSSLGIGLVAGL